MLSRSTSITAGVITTPDELGSTLKVVLAHSTTGLNSPGLPGCGATTLAVRETLFASFASATALLASTTLQITFSKIARGRTEEQ